jgi:hypothetical protein
MWRLYKTGIGLTTGFIGSHTVTHNYSVYTLTAYYSSPQHLPSLLTASSLVACLPIPQDPFAFRTNLQLCNSSLKTAASLQTLLWDTNCSHSAGTLTDWLGSHSKTDWRSAETDWLLQLTYIAWPRLLLSHVVFTARASAILYTSFS